MIIIVTSSLSSFHSTICPPNAQIQDSSLVVSVLQTSMERGLSVAECLKFYPPVNVTTTEGENTTERGNKYFIMYGEESRSRSVGQLRYILLPLNQL